MASEKEVQTDIIFRQLMPKGIFTDISSYVYENYVGFQTRLLTWGKEGTQRLEISRTRADFILKDSLPLTIARIIIEVNGESKFFVGNVCMDTVSVADHSEEEGIRLLKSSLVQLLDKISVSHVFCSGVSNAELHSSSMLSCTKLLYDFEVCIV